LLGFKTAVNGSLAKYNLQDQIIDEYEDATGIDAGNSTNERLTSGVYDGITSSSPTVTQNADSTGTDGDYTWYKWTTVRTDGTYTTDAAQDYDYIIVAGGGGGGVAGGGAGGFRTAAGLAIGATTITNITVGDGGAKADGGFDTGTQGANGGDSSFNDGTTTITSAGGGGGARYGEGQAGLAGGSGGGSSSGAAAGAGDTPDTTPDQGFIGGLGYTDDVTFTTGGGGGGASSRGLPTASSYAGSEPKPGGAGENNVMGLNDADSDAFLTAASAGHDSGGIRYFSGGGGGGADATAASGSMAGGVGGGGDGTNSAVSGNDGDANTGGGGGGGSTVSRRGDGGSGIVIIRRLTNVSVAGGDLTLQSTANTASASSTKADLIMLMENAEGTASINVDIKGYVTADGGSNWTEGTLVDEGSWGTNKKIYAFHDATVTSGTDMRYKITTHNQVEGSKETKIHATSLGWKA